jgi:glycosyltransferase involved in cell wall biosynthesis
LRDARRRLRVAYVYRDFNREGSLAAFFVDRAERLAFDEDVTVVCSAATRMATDAPLRFQTVEPAVRSEGRFGYAAECASFAVRADRLLDKVRGQFDVIHVAGFAATKADLVTVNAVRPGEIDHYFEHVRPTSLLRKRLFPLFRPQSLVVTQIERRLYKPPTPYCIAETHSVAKDLQHYYEVAADAVEVVPTGVDLRRFRYDEAGRDRVRRGLDVAAATLVVLFVGDDFERKGLDVAIDGFSAAGIDPAELWVVGGGAQAKFAAQAAAAGLRESVRFLGRVPPPDMPDIYSAADAVILPSRQDAWGQSVLEALAVERVVIVSELAGAHEIVVNGENGYVLAGPETRDQIAALLRGPVSDERVRQATGKRARIAAAAFDQDSIYECLRRAHHLAFERRMRRASNDLLWTAS